MGQYVMCEMKMLDKAAKSKNFKFRYTKVSNKYFVTSE